MKFFILKTRLRKDLIDEMDESVDIKQADLYTYGIEIYEGQEKIQSIEDLCFEREKMENFVDILNSSDVTLSELDQIIENFLMDFEI